MIDHLSIKNFAIIKETDIEFSNGLNVITGETGAGKSIVIEAISLALGARADSSMVRSGEEKATVELLSESNDGEELAVRREISSAGKNICKVNGEISTLSSLASLSKRVADIHGQYDNQTLLNPDNHLTLLDSYGKDSISPLYEAYTAEYSAYTEAKAKLQRLISTERENARRLDFYNYELEEISNANLKNGEDDELEERLAILENAEKIFDNAQHAKNLISEEDSALSSIGRAMSMLQNISEFSDNLKEISEQVENAYYILEDAASSLASVCDGMTFSTGELDQVISRLNLIDNLKKKYGSTIEDILEYESDIAYKVSAAENFDYDRKILEEEVSKCYANVIDTGRKLSSERKNVAQKLTSSIEKELSELNFNQSELSIKFEEEKEPAPHGLEKCQIYISTNLGEALKPLSIVASGGEISRIMLAIKNITSKADNIPTLIFDEIDTGISGKTAAVVGKKLKEISKNHQIICITHLPQIAAWADHSFKIFKDSDKNGTYTHVEKLNADERINEIARLLGGETITEAALENAKQLVRERTI